MNICIYGDSWLYGAYDDKDYPEPTHPGVAWYLQQDGHKVANLSARAGNNYFGLRSVCNFTKENRIDVTIIMFSDFMQDFYNRKFTFEQGYENLCEHSYLFDLQGTSIEQILLPYFIELEKNYKQKLDLEKTIFIGGDTEVHPYVHKNFPGSPTNGMSIVMDNYKDCYFENSIKFQMFCKFALRNVNIDNKARLKIILDEQNKLLKQKHEIWKQHSELLHHGHPTKKMHYIMLEKIMEKINNVYQ